MKYYIRLAALLVLMITGVAHAANCNLRNPDRQIYEIFPKATSYRTVVSTVGNEQVAIIKDRFGLDLAFTDRGKHTLYVVMKDGIPLGFVHARVEIGVRGSIELVWALDLDMRIRDFRVQRSREKYSSTIKSDAFRTTLVGRDYYAMHDLVLADGEADLDRLNLSLESQAIANCVVSCGLKTFAVTLKAFDAPLTQARLLGNIHRIFPGTANVKVIADPLNGVDGHSLFSTESMTVLRSVNAKGETLGILVHSAGEYEFWCGIDANGTIIHAAAIGANDIEFSQSVAALMGTDLTMASDLKSGPLRDRVVMALTIASNHGANRPERRATGE